MLGTDFHDKGLVDHVNIFSFRLFCNAEYDQHRVQPHRTWQYNDESSLLIVLKLCRTSCLCIIMSCEGSDPIAPPPCRTQFHYPNSEWLCMIVNHMYGWAMRFKAVFIKVRFPLQSLCPRGRSVHCITPAWAYFQSPFRPRGQSACNHRQSRRQSRMSSGLSMRQWNRPTILVEIFAIICFPRTKTNTV
jgi:hypothetical protein